MEFLKGLNQAIAFGISKEVYLDIWKKEMDLKLKTTEASTSAQKMDLSLVTEQMQKFSEQQQKIEEQQKNMLKQQQEILTQIGKIQIARSGYNHPTFENFKENIESEVSKLLESLSRLLETDHNHHVEDLEKIKGQMITEICSELKEAMKTTFNIEEIVAKVEEVARKIVCEEKRLMRQNIISALQKELDQLGSDIVYDTYDRVKDELSNQFGLHVQNLKDQESKTLATICSEVTKQVEIGIRKTLSTSLLTPSQPVLNVKGTNEKMETKTDTNKQTDPSSGSNKSQFEPHQKPSAMKDVQTKCSDTPAMEGHKEVTQSEKSVECKSSSLCSADGNTALGKEQSLQGEGQRHANEENNPAGKAFASSDKKFSEKFCSTGSLNYKGITEKTTVKGNSDPSGVPLTSEWKILSISDCWKKMKKMRFSLELSPEGYKLEVKAAFGKFYLDFYVAALTGKRDNRLDWPATFKVNISLNDNPGTGHKLYKQKHLTSWSHRATFKKPQPENGRTAPVLIGQILCLDLDPYVKDDSLLAEISIVTMPKRCNSRENEGLLLS